MATAEVLPDRNRKKRVNRWVFIGGAIILVAAMALDTTVVRVGSENDLRQQAFNPDNFGVDEFPRIREAVSSRAPDATALATEVTADKNAALKKYGTNAGGFTIVPVKFTGVVGEGQSGIFNVNVEGLPEDIMIRVQTGPAINGTELRDVTGDIEFGAFTNQIEYQNAGAGINRAMSAEILSNLDRDNLQGKTITVTGAFTMINPKNWLVTPVDLQVQ